MDQWDKWVSDFHASHDARKDQLWSSLTEEQRAYLSAKYGISFQPSQKKTSSGRTGCLILVGILMALTIFVALNLDEDRTQSQQPKAVTAKNTLPTPTPTPRPAWSIHSQTDPMTGKEHRFASSESLNTVSFEFPYHGGEGSQLRSATD